MFYRSFHPLTSIYLFSIPRCCLLAARPAPFTRARPDGSGGFDVENIMLRRSVGVSSLCQGPILLLYSHLYRLQSYQIVLLCNCNLIPHCRLTKPYACRRNSPVDRALGLVLLAPRRGNGFPPPGDCRSPLPPSLLLVPSICHAKSLIVRRARETSSILHQGVALGALQNVPNTPMKSLVKLQMKRTVRVLK